MFWSVYKLLNEIWPIICNIEPLLWFHAIFTWCIPYSHFCNGFFCAEEYQAQVLGVSQLDRANWSGKKDWRKKQFYFPQKKPAWMPISTQKKLRTEKKNYKGKSTDLRTRCFVLLWFEEFSLIQRKEFLWHSVKSNVLTRKDIVREGSGLDPGQLWKTRCVTWTRVADDPKLLHQFMCLEFSE